jgi:hypothetical protein
LAPSSNAHTYRLLIVKELYSVLLSAIATKRCVRQQQRDEIMRYSANFVNLFFIASLLKRFPMNVPQLLDFACFSTGGEL